MSASSAPRSDQSQSGRRSWTDLGPRLGSAAVLIAIVVASLWIGGYFFALVVGVAFAGAYREWEVMVARKPLSPAAFAAIALVGLSALIYPLYGPWASVGALALAAFIAVLFGGEGAAWRLAGIGFIGAVVIALLSLRGNSVLGIEASVFLGVVVWMTDSAAFFTGRQVGGEKLAPVISPSKTWSGALGGLALGTLSGAAVWFWIAEGPLWLGVLFALVTSILGQLGDLTESGIKRRFRIKDSGDIIPGHGGLMDRLDSLTFSTFFVVLVGAIHSNFADVAAGFLIW